MCEHVHQDSVQISPIRLHRLRYWCNIAWEYSMSNPQNPPVERSGLWGGVEGVMLVCLFCPVEQQRSRLTGAKPTARNKVVCVLVFSLSHVSTIWKHTVLLKYKFVAYIDIQALMLKARIWTLTIPAIRAYTIWPSSTCVSIHPSWIVKEIRAWGSCVDDRTTLLKSIKIYRRTQSV